MRYLITPDPFYKRSGFWTALAASVPLVWSLAHGTCTQEIIVATIIAWGTFFTAAGRRKTVNVKRVEEKAELVNAKIDEQAALIQTLTNGGVK